MGGTFVLVSEYLLRFNHNLRNLFALDIIQESQIIGHYRKFIDKHGGPKIIYSNKGSGLLTADWFSRDNVEETLCFIDGDHSLNGVLKDHLTVSRFSDCIVHHDISSSAVPHVALFWSFLKAISGKEWDFVEFVDQYDLKGRGGFLGIGVAKRKAQ